MCLVNRALRIAIACTRWVSVVLCLITIGLWIQSISQPYVIARTTEFAGNGGVFKGANTKESLEFYSMRGGVDVRYYAYPDGSGPSGSALWSNSRVMAPLRLSEYPASTSRWNKAGFYFARGRPMGSFMSAPYRRRVATYVFVGIPYWFIAAITALLSIAMFFQRWRTARHLTIGRCATCGYDLRATPQRCPECGTAVSKTPPATQAANT
jgi:hypothetical protein